MEKIANFFNRLVTRYLPDPFVFVIFLLLIIVIAGFIWTPAEPIEMVSSFGKGFWSLLGFTMQLSIVLVTSAAIANSHVIKTPLKYLASLPKTPAQAVFVVALVTSIVGLLNWGIALVVGIIYAKEVAKAVKGSHYPLLIAASYIGFTLWSSGLSSSIPLILNTPGHPILGVEGTIPLTETIFTVFNLIITLALLFTYAFVSRVLTPKSENTLNPYGQERESLEVGCSVDDISREDASTQDRSTQDITEMKKTSEKYLAHYLEQSRLLSIIGALFALMSFAYTLYLGGINALNLNTINMFTIGVGLLLYSGLRAYMAAITNSMKAIAPLLLLYPFYGAAQTMIADSGLGEILSRYFAGIATEYTLPFLTYIAAGFLNLFVPAAGGQIIIQGPIFIPLAEELKVPRGLVTMAITYGDTWTNLLQPFWALPALGLAGLGIRDIMGYCVIAMLVSGVVTGSLLLLLPHFI